MCKLIEAVPTNVFDVGANCGLFAALLNQKFPKSNIFCFEPSEDLHPIIKKNCEHGNVSVYNYAIGEDDQLKTFYVNPQSQQTNSLNIKAATLFTPETNLKKQVVQCRSLDSIAKENKIECVEVLKIDVQGYEGAVFRGAKKLLPTVEYLFVESTWFDIESISQILPFAISNGFKFAAVVNPVYMGADILLTKKPLQKNGSVDIVFALEEELLTSCWSS
jgi:FkbM family methyltransferase